MRSKPAWFVTLLVFGSAACDEDVGGSGGGVAEWEPAAKKPAPGVDTDRPPERGPCQPHIVKLSNGMVLEVPVECIEEGIDKGDPPPTEGKTGAEEVINPPETGQEGWQG
jgi:hypothetical protein